MQTLSISKVKDKLSEFVDAVSLTRDQVTITKNGTPAAMLVGIDEWESLQETLFWLSKPNTLDDVAEADAAFAEGRTLGEAEIREKFSTPRTNRR